MVRVCCVWKNTSKEAMLHRFPYKDKEVYNIWLTRIGKTELHGMDPGEVYKKYRLFHNHFSNYSRLPLEYVCQRTLVARSIPTIGLR
ncbi:hypothetical protein Trydic_g20313, partial [Trypoxylus dichotomus]